MTTTYDIAGLQQQRTALADQLAALNIGANSSAEDLDKAAVLSDKIEEADRQIAAAQANKQRRANGARPAHGNPAGGSVRDVQQTAADRQGLVFRTADGQEIRALTAGERFPIKALRADHGPNAGPQWSADLDFGAMFRGMALGNWQGAEAEREYVAGMGATAISGAGVMIPAPIAGKIIDQARARCRVLQAGALVVPMTSDKLTLASVLEGIQAHWKAPLNPARAGDMAFGAVTLHARTVMAYIPPIPFELIEDASNLGALIEASMATAIAEAMDRAALLGSGIGPEPKGLTKTAGVERVAVGAELTSYSPFSRGYGQLLDANLSDDEAASAIYNTRVATALDELTDTTGQPLRPPPSWGKMTHLPSNQIPNERVTPTSGTAYDSTWAVLGAFVNLLWGLRSDIRIALDTNGDSEMVNIDGKDEAASNFRRLGVSMRAFARGDVAVARPSHFRILDDIRIPVS